MKSILRLIINKAVSLKLVAHFNGFINCHNQYAANYLASPSDHFDDDGDDGDDDDGNSFSHYDAILQISSGVNDVSYLISSFHASFYACDFQSSFF